MNQNFRVGSGIKYVSLGFEFFPDFFVVVYLPVKNDTDTLIFIKNGLIATRGDVDNGQTPVSESEIPVGIYRLIIRPPMFNRGQHFRHELSVICIPFEYSGYSTHITRVCLYKSIIFSRLYYKRFSFFNAVNLWRYIFKILEIRS